MTVIQLFWLIVGASWAVMEMVIAFKTRVNFSTTISCEYRSERFIWLVVALALVVALVFKHLHLVALPIAAGYRQIIAVTLFISGLGIRCAAVVFLGQFFSTTVVTQNSHRLIETGPYQFIRHPAYTGLLLSFFAAGIAMGDGLALLMLFCPIAYVISQRIDLEEKWLADHFGTTYDDYCLRTKKLLPWVY